MYKRVFLIAVLPLLDLGSARTLVGLLVSAVAAVLAREIMPFTDSAANTLQSAAQYQISLTFLGALAVLGDAAKALGLGNFGFGLLLVAVNATVVIMVGFLSARAASADRKMKRKPPGAHW